MNDDSQQPEQDEVPQDSAPVDGTVSSNNPHPVDENPEEHIGDETEDPWDDLESTWRTEQDKTEKPEENA